MLLFCFIFCFLPKTIWQNQKIWLQVVWPQLNNFKLYWSNQSFEHKWLILLYLTNRWWNGEVKIYSAQFSPDDHIASWSFEKFLIKNKYIRGGLSTIARMLVSIVIGYTSQYKFLIEQFRIKKRIGGGLSTVVTMYCCILNYLNRLTWFTNHDYLLTIY